MPESFDPYRKWLGIPLEEQPPHCYRLLGIGLFESDPDVISNAADRQMSHVRTFQSGRFASQSQELLNELSTARLWLLDPTRKAEYDAQLRQLGYRALNEIEPPHAPEPHQYEADPFSLSGPTFPDLSPGFATGPTYPEIAPASHPMSATIPYDLSSLHDQEHPSTAAYPQRPSSSSTGWILAGFVAGVLVVVLGVVFALNFGRTEPIPKVIPEPIPKKTPDQPAPPSDKIKSPPAVPAPKPPDDATKPPPPAPKTTPDPISQLDPPKLEPPKPESPKPEPPKNPPPPAPPTLTVKPPLPDAESLRPVILQLKPAINDAIAKAHDRAERQAIVKDLITQANAAKGDFNRHYFLLKEARDLAVKIGDSELFLAAIDAWGATFECDLWEAKALAFYDACNASAKGEEFLTLLPAYEKFINLSLAVERYDIAVRAARTAISTANKYRATAAVKKMEGWAVQYEAAERERKLSETALQTLVEKPDDPLANLHRGAYLCFTRADWHTGIPYLSKSADAELKKVAELELAEPSAPEKQAELGQIWFAIGKKYGGLRKTEILKRAQQWYNRALPKLTDPTDAEAKLAEIGKLLSS